MSLSARARASRSIASHFEAHPTGRSWWRDRGGSPRAATGTAARPAQEGYRLDVQGLRALAVVAVIADHALGWPSGGFVGVDVFFVISGFLITGLLLREHDRTGRISFLGFYRRRVKRILPAAVLVLIVTTIASGAVFNAARAASVRLDALWALLFSANWRSISIGTDYFQATTPPSPLQHFWSFGVEEQFYFVWPWLMLLVFVTLGRRSVTAAHRAIAATMIVLTIASFVWALQQTAASPTSAYFSTFTRAWELGIGALLAVYAPRLRRLPAALRPVLGWVGLATIVVSFFVVTDTAAFPAPWALLPVAGAALVIAAGTGGRSHVVALTNPVATWLGELSYSLYLWHFPVIILAAALVPTRTVTSTMMVLALVLALSAASFVLVEDPIRRARFALPRRDRAARAPRAPRPELWRRRAVTGLIAVVAIGAFFTAGAYTKQAAGAAEAGAAVPLIEPSAPVAANTDGLPVVPKTETALVGQITAAVRATAWPSLSPSLDSVIGGPEAPAAIRPCGGTTPPPLAACTFGPANAKRTVVIVGDSTAVAYTSMLKQVAQRSGAFKLVALGTFGCPFTDITIGNADPKIAAACPRLKARDVATIRALKPAVVLVTDSYTDHQDTKTNTTIDEQEWQAGEARLVAKFASAAGRVAFLAPPPAQADIASCYTKVSKPADCVTTVSDTWTSYARAELAVAKSVKGAWIDSRAWFCVQDECPAFVGTTPVKLDLVHVTDAYDTKLAPFVAQDLHRAGIL